MIKAMFPQFMTNLRRKEVSSRGGFCANSVCTRSLTGFNKDKCPDKAPSWHGKSIVIAIIIIVIASPGQLNTLPTVVDHVSSIRSVLRRAFSLRYWFTIYWFSSSATSGNRSSFVPFSTASAAVTSFLWSFHCGHRLSSSRRHRAPNGSTSLRNDYYDLSGNPGIVDRPSLRSISISIKQYLFTGRDRRWGRGAATIIVGSLAKEVSGSSRSVGVDHDDDDGGINGHTDDEAEGRWLEKWRKMLENSSKDGRREQKVPFDFSNEINIYGQPPLKSE